MNPRVALQFQRVRLSRLNAQEEFFRRLDKYNQIKLLEAISKARAITPKALKDPISTPAIRDLLIEVRTISEAAGIRPLDKMIINWVRDGVSSASEIAAIKDARRAKEQDENTNSD
ncbi:MAG TPA: hypothetical protein VIH54_03175 [Chthoniobacterales bacterium]|jgi:hypothetical protein